MDASHVASLHPIEARQHGKRKANDNDGKERRFKQAPDGMPVRREPHPSSQAIALLTTAVNTTIAMAAKRLEPTHQPIRTSRDGGSVAGDFAARCLQTRGPTSPAAQSPTSQALQTCAGRRRFSIVAVHLE
jgi:hypothetical protein